jgi:excisionase family DNA binding protein
MTEQRLLTVREVAERIRSSPETVRRWLRQGKLRGFRPGGTKLGYRVPEGELQRFLAESNERQPIAPDSEGGR